MNAGKFLTGLLSGAAVGAAIGLLFAPKKGTVTRRKLTETSDNYIKGAKSKFNDFTDTLNEKAESVKDKVDSVKSKI
ncbi:MAG TPA: YtxH domain-containing protein [Gillisia sp.]|nr:YtxH domain-containing protein [Gillisia sp.]